MSDESTSGDTSAEVERIRDAVESLPPADEWYVHVAPTETGEDGEDAIADYATVGVRGAECYPQPLFSSFDVEVMQTIAAVLGGAHTLLAALDRVTEERLEMAGRAGSCLIEIGRLRAENEQLRARLPSPESVTRARLVAAEIVDVAIAEERYWRARTSPRPDPRPDRDVATACAAHIRDRARTHSGTHDEGGDVDERELLWCAARVDGCTTLGELEALVARWREVANG